MTAAEACQLATDHLTERSRQRLPADPMAILFRVGREDYEDLLRELDGEAIVADGGALTIYGVELRQYPGVEAGALEVVERGVRIR